MTSISNMGAKNELVVVCSKIHTLGLARPKDDNCRLLLINTTFPDPNLLVIISINLSVSSMLVLSLITKIHRKESSTN